MSKREKIKEIGEGFRLKIYWNRTTTRRGFGVLMDKVMKNKVVNGGKKWYNYNCKVGTT